MRGSYGASARAALLCAGALALVACERAAEPPPVEPVVVDERLETLVPDLVAAVQAKQPLFVMEHVAEDFREDGGLDYADVQSIVDSFAFRDDEIGARLLSATVEPEADGRARVRARVAFAAGRRLDADAELPEGAVVYGFDLSFARHGPRWRAVGGRYRRE